MLTGSKNMDIPFADLKPMHNEIRHELDMAYKKVMDNSWFIQGGELEAFEKEFANYIGVKHCIGVATELVFLCSLYNYFFSFSYSISVAFVLF